MTVPRLSAALLASLPPRMRVPAYDRAATEVGIVHLGLGAFHRAHQAVYTDDSLAAGEAGWGICGLSLRSSAIRDALAPQDHLYTVLERGPEGDHPRIIGSVLQALTVPQAPEAALARMADPRTRILSLTVTEKAYCRDASGGLDILHPDIRADLAGGAPPRSVPGLLVEALRRRRAAQAGPVTVLSCDNLPDNGRAVAQVVQDFARLHDPSLLGWLDAEVTFPATMVDRIVPATTEEDRASTARFGYADAWPVVAEPFSQWVVEDHFAAGRPRWEDTGALLVAEVRGYELMKLRCLNGAHSSLAYLGAVAGITTVSEAMDDAALAGFLPRLWQQDILPTLPSVPGVDLPAYTDQLITRFRNPAIRHRLLQIAMDGSQKLPQRLLAPARQRLSQGELPRQIAVAVAAWMRFLLGEDESGKPYAVEDPMAEILVPLARSAGRDAAALSETLLARQEIFTAEIATHPLFRLAVREALHGLLTDGVRATLVRP